MSSYVPAALRRSVAHRADGLCEYCLIHEGDTYFGCEVEHVIAEKHGGATTLDNLAYACAPCNRFKGSDLGSISPVSGQLIRFFNPRTDQWADHFRLEGAAFVALTEIGAVTVRIFNMNHRDRLIERQTLSAEGRYPTAAAAARMGPGTSGRGAGVSPP
jgi:HNH endonuclease